MEKTPRRAKGSSGSTAAPPSVRRRAQEIEPVVIRASKVDVSSATGVGHRDAIGDYVFVGLRHSVLDNLAKKSARFAAVAAVGSEATAVGSGAASAQIIQLFITSLVKIKKYSERVKYFHGSTSPSAFFVSASPLVTEWVKGREIWKLSEGGDPKPTEDSNARLTEERQALAKDMREVAAAADLLETSIKNADEILVSFRDEVNASTTQFSSRCESSLADIKGMLNDIRTSGAAHDRRT